LDIDVEYKIPFELNYEILENLNEFSGKIISVNINSNAAIVERRWPKEYFIEIVKFLQKTSYKPCQKILFYNSLLFLLHLNRKSHKTLWILYQTMQKSIEQ